MRNKHKAGLKENKEFYEQLYRQKNTLLHLIHMAISFDQQSKAKPNIKALEKCIDTLKFRGETEAPSVLDFGSGWGTFLRKMPKSFKLYCFDISEEAMQQSCRSLAKFGFDVEMAEVQENKITNPNNIDLIVCSHVLEHVDDDLVLLRMFHSSLKNHGTLFVNVPINEVWDDPKHVRHYTQKVLVDILHDTGFQIESISKGDKWTGFLLEKEYASEPSSTMKKFALKLIRLVLALTPQLLVEWSERVFFRDREFQQLLVTAQRHSPHST